MRPSAPPLSAGGRNGLWDQVLVDALVDAGVRDAVLCPGGRNSLLSLMLHDTPGLRCRLHVDERSAAFVALGLVLATGRPVAVCTTSGTAVANCLPALAESLPRALPLVLLTCDRPLSTRRPGEPQVIAQVAVCRPLAARQLSLDDPSGAPSRLMRLRRQILETVAGAADGSAPGPVHINIPQWGVACSCEPEADWRPETEPAAVRSAVPSPAPRPAPASTIGDVEDVADALGARPGARGLILAGGGAHLVEQHAVALAEATGFPLLAEPASGLRRPRVHGLVTTADALAIAPRPGFARTELLVRIGDAPVSRLLQDAVASLSCPTLRIAAHDRGPDFVSRACIGLLPPGPDGAAELVQRLSPGDASWSRAWAQAERGAAANRDRFLGRLPWGELRAADVVCNAGGFGLLHLANSLPVRHASLVLRPDASLRRVFVNRGANGTDGSLSTFLGELLGSEQPGVALVGDQAAAHDLSSLTSEAWRDVHGAICVIDNGGAGIFDLVACSEARGYEGTMRNRPQVDFEHAAEAFSLGYRRCQDAATLTRALKEVRAQGGVTLVHIPVGRTVARDLPRLIAAMSAGGSSRTRNGGASFLPRPPRG